MDRRSLLAFLPQFALWRPSFAQSSPRYVEVTTPEGYSLKIPVLPSQRLLSADQVRARPDMPLRYENTLLGMLMGADANEEGPGEYAIIFLHKQRGVSSPAHLSSFASAVMAMFSRDLPMEFNALVGQRLAEVSRKLESRAGGVHAIRLEPVGMRLTDYVHRGSSSQVLSGVVAYKLSVGEESEYLMRPTLAGLTRLPPDRLVFISAYGEYGAAKASAQQLESIIEWQNQLVAVNVQRK